MPLTAEAKSLAMTLIEGAHKTIKNADELFDEARLLANAGHVPRALLLHQISLEECAKAEMLYVTLTEVIRGQPVDLRSLARVLTKHAAKNRTNAYFLPKSKAEIAAHERSDARAAVTAFTELRDAFHTESNDLKNASLYVDFDGTFKAPSEVITKEDLSEILDRNRQFMSLAMDKLRLLMRWTTDLDAAAEEVDALWKALGVDALDRSKPETIIALFKRIEEMFAAPGERLHPITRGSAGSMTTPGQSTERPTTGQSRGRSRRDPNRDGRHPSKPAR